MRRGCARGKRRYVFLGVFEHEHEAQSPGAERYRKLGPE
jgi:hypothetical protein